jgi:CheY-like chemotaxis protein
VVADPVRIRQVITNLAGNAVKFTERGEVVVSVRIDSREDKQLVLHFEVRDTGIGIPPEKQKMIFEAFSQADSSTTRRFGGTGLGLTISTRLVNMMRGQLWVESQPGLGAAFHFTASLEAAEDCAAPLPAAGTALDGQRALIVDDNSTNRRMLTELLTAWKARAGSAACGGEALSAMCAAAEQGDPFQLVLVDVHMPDMDGFELAARIRRFKPAAKAVVLLLSSGERRGDVARCRELGISIYLMKPVRRAELMAAIVEALTGQAKASQDDGEADSRRERPPEAEGPGLRVLVAEDNLVNQRLALRILEKGGHTVVLAGSGTAALEALDEQAFDIVLMDVQMPDMDGLEATSAIRARERGGPVHIPIIAMTAHAMTGDRERCLQAGMDDYLSKPIRAHELLSLLTKYCEANAATD